MQETAATMLSAVMFRSVQHESENVSDEDVMVILSVAYQDKVANTLMGLLGNMQDEDFTWFILIDTDPKVVFSFNFFVFLIRDWIDNSVHM